MEFVASSLRFLKMMQTLKLPYCAFRVSSACLTSLSVARGRSSAKDPVAYVQDRFIFTSLTRLVSALDEPDELKALNKEQTLQALQVTDLSPTSVWHTARVLADAKSVSLFVAATAAEFSSLIFALCFLFLGGLGDVWH